MSNVNGYRQKSHAFTISQSKICLFNFKTKLYIFNYYYMHKSKISFMIIIFYQQVTYSLTKIPSCNV